MNLLQNLGKGNRTYVIVAAVMILGILEGLGYFVVPGWVWIVLGGSGLGFLRSGVKSVAKEIEIIKEKQT